MGNVVLVDTEDREAGILPVTEAHEGKGRLHRAVSVVAYRISKAGQELLLQKRSEKKLLWPGVWSNTVCTHPAPGEKAAEAAVRRLKEELGITVLPQELRFVIKMEYSAPYGDSYSEHELDSVYLVRFTGDPIVNPDEVSDYKWMEVGGIIADFEVNAAIYTPWFRLIMERERFRDALKTGRSV